MNQFCQMKGIKREFSVARTPQQNGVAERKKIKLSLRSPNLEFIRPFECHVTILNTLDHLGKFDGKADEGFLVGYSVNSKAFRIFNSRTRKVEENLHVNFLENKPNIAGSRPEWLFDIDLLTKSMNYEPVSIGNQSNGDAGIQIDIHAGQASQEKAGVHEYILLPFISSTPLLFLTNQSLYVNAGDQLGDVNAGNKIRIDSSTHSVNAASITLEATGIFNGAFDDRDLGAEADTNNLYSSTVVSPIPTTRVHKEHPKELIIGDLNLNTQTRRMVNFSEETAMVSVMGKLTFFLVKTASTPMETSKPLLKDKDRQEVDVYIYRSMIGSLMYLTSSRPDIMFDVLELQKEKAAEAKAAQAKEIVALKKKVSKLNKWRMSRSKGLRRLKKFGLVRRVKTHMEKDGLVSQEDGRTNDDEMFRVNDPAGEEVVMDSAADPVTTVKDSTALKTDVTKDKITMAQSLATFKSVKPKVVIQEEIRKVNDFVAMDSEAQKSSAKEAQETSTKRTVEHLESNISKKQNVDENVEPAINDSKELRKYIEIVLIDRDEVLIEATPLSSRSPTIINYKIHKEGKKNYFKIIRDDVKDRFKKEKPVDNMDNILFRTLKTMFEHHVEDTIWKYQQGLAKVYPLTRNTLHQLWSDVRLQVDYVVEMAYDLLRFIIK
nr:retrovirus-related Pol polyprotein from transposon TNT 1-94 [Tanacetum cinerariifolium]